MVVKPRPRQGRSTLAFVALLFGYATVVLVPLAIGGLAVLPRLRRRRHYRLGAPRAGTQMWRALRAQSRSWSVRPAVLSRSRIHLPRYRPVGVRRVGTRMGQALRAQGRSWSARPAVLSRSRTLLSDMSNWARPSIAEVETQNEPQTQPMEVGVLRGEKTTQPPPRQGSLAVGDRVGAMLVAAEADAERMAREAQEEAAAIRARSERAFAVGVAELARETDRIKSEAVAGAQALREEAESYAVEHLDAANERAAKVIARAEARAQARRASAEAAARLVDESHRRQVALKEAADSLEEHLRAAVDERLHAALQGLENLAGGLEELLSDLPSEEEVTPVVTRRRAVSGAVGATSSGGSPRQD